MSLRALTLCFVILIAGSALAAEKPGPNDWPQWRGPNGDGKSLETGLLQSWPKDGPAKLWSAKDLGLGFGTPSVAVGKIFGMGTREGKDGVWALKEADGSELWFTPLDAPRNTNQNNGPSSTPTYYDGKLYVVGSTGTIARLDAGTGTIDWRKSFKEFGAGVPSWGFTQSVLIDGDKVICAPCGNKGAVVALKPASGEVIWATETNPGGAAGYSTPMKATVGGIPMYVVLLGKGTGVVGVHAETGKLLWNYAKVANGVANIPTVIVKDNLIWCSSGYRDGGSALIKLTVTGDKVSAEEVVYYSADELQNHHGNMILVGDYVYLGKAHVQGHPACVEMKTGEIKWKEKGGAAGGSGSAAVSFADNRLYFRYENGMMVLIEPDPNGLKVMSSFKLPPPNIPKGDAAKSWAHPAIANGKLYIRDQNVLYCYNVKASTN